MIAAISVLVMAMLFVVFGLLRLGNGSTYIFNACHHCRQSDEMGVCGRGDQASQRRLACAVWCQHPKRMTQFHFE